MSELHYIILAFGGCLFAGFIGALTGLGGGIIVIPILTLFFKIDLHYAVGASLISVIATSSGSAAAYVREGITNIRIGMFLEIATTIGAVAGAVIAVYLNANVIAIIFGGILMITSINMFKAKKDAHTSAPAGKLAVMLKLNGTYPVQGQQVPYTVHNVGGGFLMMLAAGCLSGLLGIGSGVLKVLAMDNIMKLPFKVSTTTSNFMIGVTAAASAFIYFQRGQIQPIIALPVALGVLTGAVIGARMLPRINTKILKIVFAIIVVITAVQMIYKGFTGGF